MAAHLPPDSLFEHILAELQQSQPALYEGSMMRSRAYRLKPSPSAPPDKKDPCLAFLHSRTHDMVFSLGTKERYSEELPAGIVALLHPFNPFKNKGPLAGWFGISADEATHWHTCARYALRLAELKLP